MWRAWPLAAGAVAGAVEEVAVVAEADVDVGVEGADTIRITSALALNMREKRHRPPKLCT